MDFIVKRGQVEFFDLDAWQQAHPNPTKREYLAMRVMRDGYAPTKWIATQSTNWKSEAVYNALGCAFAIIVGLVVWRLCGGGKWVF
jgi:anti-sigma-K factor RskA